MSDKLDKLMEEKYKEVLEQQKESLEKESPKEVTVETKKEVLYFPYRTADRQDSVVKLEFSIELNKDGDVVRHDSKIVGVSELDQKIIAQSHPRGQESLKHYYDKNKKRGF